MDRANISRPIRECKHVVDMAVGPSSSSANSPTAPALSSDWGEFIDMHEEMQDELEDPSDDDLRSARQRLANGARTSPEIKRRIVRFATRDPIRCRRQETVQAEHYCSGAAGTASGGWPFWHGW